MVRIDRGLVDRNVYASQEELYWIEEYGGGGGGKNKNEKRKLREQQQQQTKGKIQQRSTQGNHCMRLKKMSRNGLLYHCGYWPQCLTIAVINYLQADKFESFILKVYIHDS